MTQRAFEREQYKRKKRLPAPEVPKPKNHHKPEKNILLQYRWDPEYVAKINKTADEYGVKEQLFNNKIFKVTMWRITSNEWRTQGKYADIKTAQMVLDKEKLKYPLLNKPDVFSNEYEYRIISKEDAKREEYEKRHKGNETG